MTQIIYFYFLGVQGVQVEELWSLEPEQFENLKYVLIILKSSFNVTIVFFSIILDQFMD